MVIDNEKLKFLSSSTIYEDNNGSIVVATDIFTKGLQGQIFVRLLSWSAIGKTSDERECSDKLHPQSYSDMLWSKTGYLGLLGNNHFF